ncbi:MAG: thiamine phosphate synthase [Candidatus Eisenbacteria bacterium]|nr:thiamine phosphate synthase [Candidatus Latescibacterota bacterium]MBD3301452.1 thiamine phosphate synthase [Candidatus Eisenbacteria bacterium]
MFAARLHILTDTELQDRYSHAELTARAIRGGAEAIQLRRKQGTTRDRISEAVAVHAICRRKAIPLIVNDRIDVAIAADAEGVHLGRSDFPIPLAREILGPHRWIGGSAATLEEAREAWRDGADYVGFGPVFATGSKTDASPATGIEALRTVASASPVPILAIGGVTEANLPELLEAGAFGAAVISSVCCRPDPEEATRSLRAILDRSR